VPTGKFWGLGKRRRESVGRRRGIGSHRRLRGKRDKSVPEESSPIFIEDRWIGGTTDCSRDGGHCSKEVGAGRKERGLRRVGRVDGRGVVVVVAGSSSGIVGRMRVAGEKIRDVVEVGVV
jgi:hypothetical protein